MADVEYECLMDDSHPKKLAKKDAARLPLCCGEPMVPVTSEDRPASSTAAPVQGASTVKRTA